MSAYLTLFYRIQLAIPLSSPVHQVVTGEHGGEPEEDLGLCAAENVEDGIVSSSGKGVLTVSRETVVNDALLLGTTCMIKTFGQHI